MKRTEEEIREFVEINIHNLRNAFSDALSKIGTENEMHKDFVTMVLGKKDAFLNLEDFLNGEMEMPEKVKEN